LDVLQRKEINACQIAALKGRFATDPGRFEDYARKMYPQYNQLNVPT